MNLWLDSYMEILVLGVFLAGFIIGGWKDIKYAILAVIFFLPLYQVRIKIFFLPLNVLEIMVWLVFLIWLVRRKYNDIHWPGLKNFFWPAGLILAGAALAAFFSPDIKISLGILKGWFLAPMVFALIVSGQPKNTKDILSALAALFISSALVALTALGYYFTDHLTFDSRLSAFYLSPNHLAMYLAPGFLSGLIALRMTDKLVGKIMIVLALSVIGLVLYLAYSYAAWLAVLAAISVHFLVASDKKNLKKKAFVLGTVLLCVIAFLIFSQLDSQKLMNLLDFDRSSFRSRLIIWRAAWMIGNDNLFLGIGPGMFQQFYLRYQVYFPVPYLEWAVPEPHNLFLAFWLATGLLGLAGFLWLIINFFRETFLEKKQQPLLAAGLTGLMVYVLAHGFVDTPYFKNDLAVIFWLLIALAVGLSRQSCQSRTPDYHSD